MSDIVEQLEAWIRPTGTNIDLPLYREAAAKIRQLRDKVRNLTKLLDDQVGTPCEQIRYQQEIGRLRQDEAKIRALVDEQAADEGLWFEAETCAEAYVQQALRRLHAVIEGKSP